MNQKTEKKEEKNPQSYDFSNSKGAVSFIATFEEQNKKHRKYMEDGSFVEFNVEKVKDQDEYLFGVLDGHGGRGVMEFSSEKIPENFRKKYKPHKSNIPGILTRVFQDIDSELEETGKEESGSTCCVCFIRKERGKDYCYLANLGDTRAVLVSEEDKKIVAISKTIDHKASSPIEQERIKQSGGTIIQGRVSGSLAVSRALGDLDLKKEGVINIPDVSYFEIKKSDKYLVIATDGLWDVITLDDIAKAFSQDIKEGSEEKLCQDLIEEAITKASKDNITCMIVKFRNKTE